MTRNQKEVVKKWLAALRSGSYRQGRGKLRRGDEFCCLGVLCDLAVQCNVILESVKSQVLFGVHSYDGATAVLPKRVADWAGLSTVDGVFTNDNGQITSLTGLNDNGESFATIADVIASKPTGLFK